MKPIRVLLVDDNAQFLRTASRLLAKDARIIIAGEVQSGHEALELVKEEAPDLVLMDLAMPGINGLDATRQIKQHTNAPLIIILTFYDNAEYRDAARLAGADGFVAKSELGTKLAPLIQGLFGSNGEVCDHTFSQSVEGQGA
jgi:two-component system invasion response regulator UvrY